MSIGAGWVPDEADGSDEVACSFCDSAPSVGDMLSVYIVTIGSSWGIPTKRSVVKNESGESYRGTPTKSTYPISRKRN